ncbi:MAG: hypothetical protein R3B47_03100 [Bacteroidia bacterium]
MSFRYREIQLSDPEMAKAVLALAGAAFGHIGGLAGLRRLIEMPEAGVAPLCLGAFFEDKLAGFLACTPHRFTYENDRLLLYQPAWAVTGEAFRGKGIFRNLIQTAEAILAPQGAGGMFASPNPRSGPVFTGPLGFSHLGHLLIGTAWGGRGIARLGRVEEYPGHFRPVEDDLLAWQHRRLGEGAISFQQDKDGNFIWAKKRSLNKMGTEVTYWLPGGINAKDPEALKSLLKAMPYPRLGLFFMTASSRYRSFFAYKKPSKSLYLVWKSYDKNLPHHPPFDAMMGLFDHF